MANYLSPLRSSAGIVRTRAQVRAGDYSARTVELYSDLLDQHALPILGAETKATAVRIAQVNERR